MNYDKPFTINKFSASSKHLSATGHWSASEVICFSHFLGIQCPCGLFTVHWGRRACQGEMASKPLGLEIKMFSQSAETFTSKERRGSLRTFKVTAWRLPEPCQGSEGYNTATMIWKIHGNQDCPHSQGLPQFSQR